MRSHLMNFVALASLVASSAKAQTISTHYQGKVEATIPLSLGTQGSVSFRLLPYAGPAIVDLTLPAAAGASTAELIIDSANAASFGINWPLFESSMLHPFELRVEAAATLPDGASQVTTHYILRPPSTRLLFFGARPIFDLERSFDGWQQSEVIGQWRAVFAIPEPSVFSMAAAGVVGLWICRRPQSSTTDRIVERLD